MTSRTLHALILSSYLAFLGGMLIAAMLCYAGKPVDLGGLLISFLLSATDNPRGYRIAAAGASVCGALLLPVAFAFYQKLASRHRAAALVGCLLFALGPLCALSMIFFTGDINDTHVQLAFAAYFFMTSGLLVCVALAGLPAIRIGGRRGLGIVALLISLLAILVFLVYLEFTPDFFNNRDLLHNVAFCEWALCFVIAACISGLAGMLTRPTR